MRAGTPAGRVWAPVNMRSLAPRFAPPRTRLVSQVAPERVSTVRDVLQKYAGNELTLVQNLRKKYIGNPIAMAALSKVEAAARIAKSTRSK